MMLNNYNYFHACNCLMKQNNNSETVQNFSRLSAGNTMFLKKGKNMLETERLILREIKQTDIEDFYEIFSTDEVGRFINKMSHADVERYFEKKKQKPKNPFSFAVVLKENNKMIGTCGVKLNTETNVGTLSYVFNPKFWNKGFCTEACKAVIKFCFEFGKMDEIQADCFDDNLSSIHILQDKLHMHNVSGKQRWEMNNYTKKITAFKFFAITKQEFFENY